MFFALLVMKKYACLCEDVIFKCVFKWFQAKAAFRYTCWQDKLPAGCCFLVGFVDNTFLKVLKMPAMTLQDNPCDFVTAVYPIQLIVAWSCAYIKISQDV